MDSTVIDTGKNFTLCPWDSPGKNTGVGCHFLLQCMKVKSERSRSVVSDSSRPHELKPTRLLHPWDFPGKSTGVGCHCLFRTVRESFHKQRTEVSTLPLKPQFQKKMLASQGESIYIKTKEESLYMTKSTLGYLFQYSGRRLASLAICSCSTLHFLYSSTSWKSTYFVIETRKAYSSL